MCILDLNRIRPNFFGSQEKSPQYRNPTGLMEEAIQFLSEVKPAKLTLSDVDIPSVLLIMESVEFLNNVNFVECMEATVIYINEH